MLSMGVCTTRQWQTSGRLVQELNVCTVPYDLYSQIQGDHKEDILSRHLVDGLLSDDQTNDDEDECVR